MSLWNSIKAKGTASDMISESLKFDNDFNGSALKKLRYPALFQYSLSSLDSIPLILSLRGNKNGKGLVLCPTRELSCQVSLEIKKLIGKDNFYRIATIYGGESYEKQFRELDKNPNIVVGFSSGVKE